MVTSTGEIRVRSIAGGKKRRAALASETRLTVMEALEEWVGGK